MSKIKYIVLPMLIIALLSTAIATPALAQSDSGDDTEQEGNFICVDGETPQSEGLASLLNSVLTLVVTLAALIGVGGGAAYTLASAAKPTEEKYQENRNRTILFGVGTLVILYGANAIVTQIDENLDFGCILPFVN